MPYQDRHPVEGPGVDTLPVASANAKAPESTNNGRTIQIIIVVGLVAAVIVAIFGSY